MRTDGTAAPTDTTTASPVVLHRLALDLAVGAARLVRDGATGAAELDTKSTPTDLVTSVDRASERWLVDEIARRRPGDDVLGEEGGAHERDRPHGVDGPRVRWVLDPIDGTVNFVLGLPQYAVSVAAEVDGAVVAGAVANPATGETFHAWLGGGAWLGDRRLSGPRAVGLDRAVVATGFGYDAALRARQAAVVAALLPRVGDLRRLGAAALDLCFVAAGRLDAYFEAGLNPWDHAAGGLVAAEAGCIVTGGGVSGEQARAPSDRLVLAAGPDLIDDLASVLGELGADRVVGAS